MKKTYLLVPIALLVCACTAKENTVASSLPDMSAVRANLAFTCTHESDHLPALDPKADTLFQYGRYLQKKDGPKDFNDVARYYRIAAAYGHFKANHNAQLLISQGLADSPDAPKETIGLAAQLVKDEIPGGYYDIGHYLETGYGLKQDEEMALRYFRKAADLGNPEAQAYVAEQLAPHDKAPDIARQMRQCAADQGYGDAANALGINLKNDAQYPQAVIVFQKGVEAGSRQSALALESGFKGPLSSDRLSYLALSDDTERTRRYRAIGQFIDANDGRNPKIPDVDKIVPLPPAKLPPWDGTFEWQKQEEAAIAPQKPSDEFIDQLAKAKQLDPATGLPISGMFNKISQADEASNVAARIPLGTLMRTGDACPQAGIWQVKLDTGQLGDAKRRFLKGDTLPSLVVQEPRQLALLDRVIGSRRKTADVAWELMKYIEEA
jgi:uncharacterized protein